MPCLDVIFFLAAQDFCAAVFWRSVASLWNWLRYVIAFICCHPRIVGYSFVQY